MKDFLVGHAGNQHTGCTVIIAPSGAVGGVDIRGGAPGTRETALLAADKTVERVHAVVLSGGSAFGLEASCGVMKWLSEQGIGVPFGGAVVPIVSSAVLFDLCGGKPIYPDIDMGYLAASTANNGEFSSGKIGAGIGAKIGKIRGIERASMGGLGQAVMRLGEAEIRAIVAVNALGDVFDMRSGKIVAGARADDGTWLDTEQAILRMAAAPKNTGENTTIGVIYTNAKLSKIQANKLAKIAHNGLAQSIRPVHTDFDGDTLFALSSSVFEVDFTALSVAAVECVRLAVLDAVGGVR